MHKIDTSTAVTVQPTIPAAGPNPGWFSDAVPPTAMSPAWANSMQAELVNVVTDPTGGNFSLSKQNQHQVLDSIKAIVARNRVVTVQSIAPDSGGNVDVSPVFVKKGGDSMTGALTVPFFYCTNDVVSEYGRMLSKVKSNGAINTPQPDGSASYAAATLSTEFALNGAQTGYQKLPNGLIIQWGRGVTSSGRGDYVPYAASYPSACLIVIANEGNAVGWAATNPPGPTVYGVTSQGLGGFYLYGVTVGTSSSSFSPGITYNWISVGF